MPELPKTNPAIKFNRKFCPARFCRVSSVTTRAKQTDKRRFIINICVSFQILFIGKVDFYYIILFDSTSEQFHLPSVLFNGLVSRIIEFRQEQSVESFKFKVDLLQVVFGKVFPTDLHVSELKCGKQKPNIFGDVRVNNFSGILRLYYNSKLKSRLEIAVLDKYYLGP